MKTRIKYPRFLKNLDLHFTALLVSALVLLTIIGILVRYFFNKPFPWLEEITSLCFLWSILIGAAAAFRMKSHVAIEIVVERFSKKNQRVIEAVITIITALLLIYLTIQAVIYLGTVTGANRRTGLLRLPYGIIYGMLPVSTVLMLANLLYAFFKDFRAWKKEDAAPPPSAPDLDKEIQNA